MYSPAKTRDGLSSLLCEQQVELWPSFLGADVSPCSLLQVRGIIGQGSSRVSNELAVN